MQPMLFHFSTNRGDHHFNRLASSIHCSKYVVILAVVLCLVRSARAQSDSSKEVQLQEITVQAFDQGKKVREVPAALNYVSKSMLERSTPVSIVQAVNSTPGVRMEERSPGSYRFNIRGSSLRSPFGVRNIKVYYNDIPITDPGGQTYLNQLGYYNFNSIEIIKGPGSSLYGAGTGGVLLIESMSGREKPGAFGEYTTGSYDLQNAYASVTTGSDRSVSKAGFQHQQSDGYRDHAALRHEVHSWNGLFRIGEENLLKTTFLYGDLSYETPGALTRPEYEANPRASRPGTPASSSAIAAGASVRERTAVAGASYEQQLFPGWRNKSVLYGMFTELRNPTIQNYGRNTEPHVGGRTTFSYHRSLPSGKFSLDLGGEWQEGFANVSIFKNVGGKADSLRTTDEINSRTGLIFGQALLDLNRWSVNLGTSLNFLRVRLERFAPASLGKQERKISNQVEPRLAIAYKLGNTTLYTTVAKGFSPPTTAELAPTGGAINLDLQPERGWNYEAGVKGNALGNLYFDVNAFYFSLQDAIVQRRTALGGDYFINAGKTKQYGVETYLSYPLFSSSMEQSLLWLSHTYHHFTYQEFKQVAADYSGNFFPAEAKHTVSAGYDFVAKNGLLGTVSYYYSDPIPLNDANSEYASPYHLIGLKAGYQAWIKGRWRLKLYAGIDNLLDQRYSLGNDINGFGGRYYNAAAGRNWYAGVLIQWLRHKAQ